MNNFQNVFFHTGKSVNQKNYNARFHWNFWLIYILFAIIRLNCYCIALYILIVLLFYSIIHQVIQLTIPLYRSFFIEFFFHFFQSVTQRSKDGFKQVNQVNRYTIISQVIPILT